MQVCQLQINRFSCTFSLAIYLSRLGKTCWSRTSTTVFPMPRFWLYSAGESVFVTIFQKPLIHLTTAAIRLGSCLWATVGVQIQRNSLAVIRSAWPSRQVPIVTRSGLITVPEVLLTSDRAKTRGDGDGHTGLFRSGCQFVKGACRCRCHRVVGCSGSSGVYTGVGQMLWSNLDHGVDDIVVASDGANSRTGIATTETSTGTRRTSSSDTALNVGSTRTLTSHGGSSTRRGGDADSALAISRTRTSAWNATLNVGSTGTMARNRFTRASGRGNTLSLGILCGASCLWESSEWSKDEQTDECRQHGVAFDANQGWVCLSVLMWTSYLYWSVIKLLAFCFRDSIGFHPRFRREKGNMIRPVMRTRYFCLREKMKIEREKVIWSWWKWINDTRQTPMRHKEFLTTSNAKFQKSGDVWSVSGALQRLKLICLKYSRKSNTCKSPKHELMKDFWAIIDVLQCRDARPSSMHSFLLLILLSCPSWEDFDIYVNSVEEWERQFPFRKRWGWLRVIFILFISSYDSVHQTSYSWRFHSKRN